MKKYNKKQYVMSYAKKYSIHLKGLAVGMVGLTLASCSSYQPLYSVANLQDSLADVKVVSVIMEKTETMPAARRAAQLLRVNLTEKFTAIDSHIYKLSIVLREDKSTLAVRRDATEQRLQLNLNADIIITNSNGDKVFDTVVSSSAPYNVEDTPYSTDSGKERARQSAVNVLSEEITRRVSLFLYGNK